VVIGTITVIVGFVLGTIAFLLWERDYSRRGKSSVVHFALFRIASYRNGILVATAYFAAIPGTFLLTTLYLQQGLGALPVFAGMVSIPFALTSAASSLIGGRIVERYGRKLVVIGTITVNNGEFVKDDLRISAVRGQDNIVSAVLTYTPVDLIKGGAIISSVESATGTTIGANGTYDSAFVGGGYFNGEIAAGGVVDVVEGSGEETAVSGEMTSTTYTVSGATQNYVYLYNRDTVTYDIYDSKGGNLLEIEQYTAANTGILNVSGGNVVSAEVSGGGVVNVSGGSVSDAVITSGGVAVKEINPRTMESKICPNLYFIGEVIDVDAYTGGYNLQIAFSTAYAAAQAINEG
jgi:hypothetical protein